MNIVSFTIELKDKFSEIIKKNIEFAGKLSGEMKEVQSQTKKYQDLCSRLEIPNLNAMLQVAERVGGVLETMTDKGMSFGQSMADLSAITGIVGEDLQSLEQQARKFGAESGLGADTAARAYTVLASQIQVSEIGMDGLNKLQEKSILLAQASGMTLDAAAESLAGTINQFSLSADEANRVVNVLAAGSKYGAAEISELSQSFKVVGSAASAMGLDVESTAGALEVLSKANLKGSEAGTALRNIILKLNTTLGIDLGETSLGTALEALKPKLTDAAYLSKVFGAENIAAAQFLIQNAQAVDEMTRQLTGTNVAEEQAAIRTQTTAQSMAELRAQVDDIKIGFANMIGSLGPWVAIISENADAVSLSVAAISHLGSKIVTINKAIGTLTGSTLVQKTVTMATAAATKTWAGVQAVLNAVMSANPIAGVVLAIGILVAAIVACYKNFDGFRQVCDTVWEAVKNIASAVWGYLVTAFERCSDVVRKAWGWVRKFFGLGGQSEAGQAASDIDKETRAIENNTAAKRKNMGIKLDFSFDSDSLRTPSGESAKVQLRGLDETRLNERLRQLQAAMDAAPTMEAKLAFVPEIDSVKKALDDISATIDAHRFRLRFEQGKDGMPALDGGSLLPKVDTGGLIEQADQAFKAFQERFRQQQVDVDVDEKGMKGFSDKTRKAVDDVGQLGGALSSMGSQLGIPALDVAGTIAQAVANVALSYSEATKGAATLGPFGWIAFAAAGLAQMVAVIASIKQATAFADGGIVSGPTYALVGEYAGARNNPEVIAPLDKLRGMIAGSMGGGGTGGRVVFRISGRELTGVLENEYNHRRRS